MKLLHHICHDECEEIVEETFRAVQTELSGRRFSDVAGARVVGTAGATAPGPSLTRREGGLVAAMLLSCEQHCCNQSIF